MTFIVIYTTVVIFSQLEINPKKKKKIFSTITKEYRHVFGVEIPFTVPKSQFSQKFIAYFLTLFSICLHYYIYNVNLCNLLIWTRN